MIRIQNLNKSFPEFKLRVPEIEILPGQYWVLLGDSGSGKSMFLEILSGLLNADSGSIYYKNHDLVKQSVQKRPFGMVFQDLALFPHLSVRNNIAYAIRQEAKQVQNKVIQDIAEKLEIKHLLNRSISGLSGGEQQRVALARILVKNPEVLLLDEPLSALDAQRKKEIRALLRWLNKLGQTIIHVTHDYEEAIALATHIGVMDRGELIQAGPAEQILKEPKSSFVANFTGIQNYFKVDLVHDEKSGVTYGLTPNGIRIHISTSKKGGTGYVIVPSESVVISKKQVETSAANQFYGQIKDIAKARFGMEIRIDAELSITAQVTVQAVDKLNLKEGQFVWVYFKASSIRFVKK